LNRRTSSSHRTCSSMCARVAASKSWSRHHWTRRSRCSPSGSEISSHPSTTCSRPHRRDGVRARAGGHIYDRGTDGSECRWARVLAFEPPRRVVFSWDIGPTWQLETELENASEVEVRFIAETTDRTGWSWSIGRSTGMVPAGRQSPRESATTRAGRCTSSGTPPCSPSAASDLAAQPGHSQVAERRFRFHWSAQSVAARQQCRRTARESPVAALAGPRRTRT
jgi:hypothetical protein